MIRKIIMTIKTIHVIIIIIIMLIIIIIIYNYGLHEKLISITI